MLARGSHHRASLAVKTRTPAGAEVGEWLYKVESKTVLVCDVTNIIPVPQIPEVLHCHERFVKESLLDFRTHDNLI